MKNKWNLLYVPILLGLIFLVNNHSIAQFLIESDNRLSSIRTLYFNELDLYDPLDTVYSAEYEKIKYEQWRIRNLETVSNFKIDSLISITKNKNLDIDSRFDALSELQYINSKKQIPYIEKILLTDTNEYIRAGCISVFYRLNSINSKNVLIKALNKETYKNNKRNIALLLATMGEKEHSFKALQSIWYMDGFKVSCHSGFVDINTPESINMLRLALKHSSYYVSLDAAACLAILNYKEEALEKIKEALALQLDSTQDIFYITETEIIKIIAMKVLAYYIGGDEAFNILIKMRKDSNQEIRRYCYRILNRYFKNRLNKLENKNYY